MQPDPKEIARTVPGPARTVLTNALRQFTRKPVEVPSVQQHFYAFLEQFKEDFAKVGIDLRYFTYLLEFFHGNGKLADVLEGMKLPPHKTLGEVLPPACLEKLKEFANNLQNGTLIEEPGKATVTMLRERVLDPFADEIKKHFADMDYVAITLCNACNINPY